MSIDEKAWDKVREMMPDEADFVCKARGVVALYEKAKQEQPDELPKPKCPEGGCHGACPYCYGFYVGQESCEPFL